MAPDIVKVQITFEAMTKYGVFRDALWYTMEDYLTATDTQKDLAKSMRVFNHVDKLDNPPPPPEPPTKEQLESDKAALLEQVAQLDAQIAEKGK